VAALSDDERVELARLLDKLSASIARSLGDDAPGAGAGAGAEQNGRAGEAGRADSGDGGPR